MYSDQFDCFFKVLETGSITEAARQMFISQSALSQRIMSIERRIGAKIFDRGTTPITLTYEGELFYRMVLSIAEAEGNFTHSLNDMQEGRLGKLKVAMTTMRSQQMLHLLVPRFKERFPAADFVLLHEHDSDLVDLVLSGKADLAFISRRAIHPALTYVPLADSEILLSVPPQHPLAKEANGVFDWRVRPPINLAHVKDESFILIDGYPHFVSQVNQIFDEYRFSPNVYLRLSDFYTAHQLSINGAGFSLVYDSSALQMYPKGVYFRLDRGMVKSELKLCYKTTRYPSRIMLGFIEISEQTCADLYQSEPV